MESKKFRSSIGWPIYLVLILYHISIIALFILPYFLYKDVTTKIGIFLLILNVLFLYPLIFNTYYSLNEHELFVHQWPFTRKKIRYCDIFEITDVLPDGIKKVKKFSLGTPKFFVGYYSDEVDKETKKQKRVKNYIEISPKDIDLFLIKIGGKFKLARDLAAKLEEEHNKRNEEHFKKKALADKTRKEKEEQNKPVDVVMTPVKKTDAGVKVEETEE